MPSFIRWAKAKKMKQPIYALAPESHQGKKNTPTMGGLVFMTATLLATALSAKMDDLYVISSIFLMLGFMAIGLTDDMGKITGGKNELGLSARGKLYAQFFVALVISSFLFFYLGFPTSFYVPFLKSPLFDMGLLAIPFWALVMVAASNAVNITDGLDGLATGDREAHLPGGRRQRAQDASGNGGLAATALAHQGERLALGDME